jgi:predicted XRE-type DNA-binding protein
MLGIRAREKRSHKESAGDLCFSNSATQLTRFVIFDKQACMSRKISWVKAALKDFGALPEPAQRQVIIALRMAAAGEKAETAKPIKGLGASCLPEEIKDRHPDAKSGDRPDSRADKAPEGAAPMSEEKLEIVRGTDNPFADVGLPDADAELMKADLATEIVRILRERNLTGARAADLAGVTEADISRIRKGSLDRFTIDRLVKILNRLDIEVTVRTRPRRRESCRESASLERAQGR